MFVHLHVHTEYSFQDSTLRVRDMVERAAAFGMPAVAMTDHGHVAGLVPFAEACAKAGIRPIFGCEFLLVPDMHVKRRGNEYGIVVLARTQEGYANLLRLASEADVRGKYYTPRIDRTCLARYAAGLTGLSGCPVYGEIPQSALLDEEEDFLSLIEDYAEIFDGHFCLEILGRSHHARQLEMNRRLIKAAKELDLPFVAANNCHFLHREDKDIRDMLLSTRSGGSVPRPEYLDDAWFCPEETMRDMLLAAGCDVEDTEAALAATGDIAMSCEAGPSFGTYHFPSYPLPDGVSADDEFERMAREGLERRFSFSLAHVTEKEMYRSRLEHEIGVIRQMGFAQYFLIVQDFINWAKDNGVPVGPGRGSGAGSLAAYALRITNIDPLPYGLLFERFLNPERVSMPDIDVDFCESRRHRVIRYMSERYGADKTAQIANVSYMRARTAIRDVARALRVRRTGEELAAIIPDDAKVTLVKAKEDPQIQAFLAREVSGAHIYEKACGIEGLPRQMGVHAAGLVCSPTPMTDFCAVMTDKEGKIVSQCDMHGVESIGLVKFDFLGLRTLTVIDETLVNIRHLGQEPPNLERIPMDDPLVYALYASGDMLGVFQMESEGMRQYLRKLRPTCFEDIIAMCALYRPGPLGSGMVDSFIRRKHGEEAVEYFGLDGLLEPILAPTYGVIVYQEQVMRIAQAVAGYTLGGADLLRRAMGKKKPEEMAKQRDVFLRGAEEKGIPVEKARTLFDLMEKFAEYGFNKSHSAAYALISYQTAWLRVHYPTAFFSALLTCEARAGADDLFTHIVELRQSGALCVERPDIHESEGGFTPLPSGHARYGLKGIKGVGDGVIEDILAWRARGLPRPRSVTEFLIQCPLPLTALTALCECGALDGFLVPRWEFLHRIKEAQKYAAQCREALEKAGTSGMLEEKEWDFLLPACVKKKGMGLPAARVSVKKWSYDECMEREFARIGVYLTDAHPVAHLRTTCEPLRTLPLLARAFAQEEETIFDSDDIPDMCSLRGKKESKETTVWYLVKISDAKKRTSKKGKIYIACTIEDETVIFDALAFSVSKSYKPKAKLPESLCSYCQEENYTLEDVLLKNSFCLVTLNIKKNDGDDVPTIFINEAVPFDFLDKKENFIKAEIDVDFLSEKNIDRIRAAVELAHMRMDEASTARLLPLCLGVRTDIGEETGTCRWMFFSKQYFFPEDFDFQTLVDAAIEHREMPSRDVFWEV